LPCYTIGFDVGLKHDPSAFVLAERVHVIRNPERLPEQTFETATTDSPAITEMYHVHAVRELVRTPMEQQIEYLSAFLSEPELRDDTWLIYDETGVGGSFGQAINAAWAEGRLGRCMWPLGCSITGGEGRPQHGGGVWQRTVRKIDLVGRLRMLFEQRRILVPVGLPGGEQLLKELRGFTAKPSATGRMTYEAATESIHDDIVIALAFAVYFINWGHEPRWLDATGQLKEKAGRG
jgi:hypothetical protein